MLNATEAEDTSGASVAKDRSGRDRTANDSGLRSDTVYANRSTRRTSVDRCSSNSVHRRRTTVNRHRDRLDLDHRHRHALDDGVWLQDFDRNRHNDRNSNLLRRTIDGNLAGDLLDHRGSLNGRTVYRGCLHGGSRDRNRNRTNDFDGDRFLNGYRVGLREELRNSLHYRKESGDDLFHGDGDREGNGKFFNNSHLTNHRLFNGHRNIHRDLLWDRYCDLNGVGHLDRLLDDNLHRDAYLVGHVHGNLDRDAYSNLDRIAHRNGLRNGHRDTNGNRDRDGTRNVHGHNLLHSYRHGNLHGNCHWNGNVHVVWNVNLNGVWLGVRDLDFHWDGNAVSGACDHSWGALHDIAWNVANFLASVHWCLWNWCRVNSSTTAVETTTETTTVDTTNYTNRGNASGVNSTSDRGSGGVNADIDRGLGCVNADIASEGSGGKWGSSNRSTTTNNVDTLASDRNLVLDEFLNHTKWSFNEDIFHNVPTDNI